MKLLIAFALFAVAFADEVRDEVRVVPLPPSPLFARPSLGQVFIRNYIVNAIKVGTPVMRDEAVDAADDGLRAIYVDSRLDADVNPSEALEVFEAPEPITLGEALLPAFETADIDVAPVAEEIIPDAVKFVDSPLEVAPVAEEIAPEPVLIAEAPLPAYEEADVNAEEYDHALLLDDAPVAEEIVPVPVRFVDSPIDVAPIAEEIIPDAVKFVDSPVEVAPVAEEIVPEAVRFDDSPADVAPVAEEIIPDAVKFVDSPLEVAPVAEEIAPETVLIAEAPVPAYEVADVNAEEYDHALLLDDAPVAEEIVPEPVHFVEVAEPTLDAAEIIYGVSFIDGPLNFAPEAVKIAEPVLPEVSPVAEEIVPEPVLIGEAAEDVDATRFDGALLLAEAVKNAVHQFRDYRDKQFNDPRLRSMYKN